MHRKLGSIPAGWLAGRRRDRRSSVMAVIGKINNPAICDDDDTVQRR